MYKIESIKLHKIDYSIKDENFQGNIETNLHANFTFNIIKDEKKLKIRCKFQIVDEKIPFSLESVIEATFVFDDFPNMGELARIIHTGGPEILVPFQREIISSITTKSFNIPMLIPYTPHQKDASGQQKDLDFIIEQLKEIFDTSEQAD